MKKKTHLVRFNGKKGVGLNVIKKEKADIIRTIKQIKDWITEFQKTPYGKNIDVDYLNDYSEDTRTKLNIVSNNALIGLILVISVLFLFLNVRTAIWTAFGLPVSIFMAIILMHITGITINAISLSGIIIVLGMLVDDAIIVSENTYRHHLAGETWKEAALNGVYEVSQPVFATVSTTIIAFIPILFMGGMTGDFAYEIPLVVAFTLGASLLEAFFILPQHLSHEFIKKKKTKATLEEKGNQFFEWFQKWYEPLLRKSLRHRYLIILLFIGLLLGAGIYAYYNMKFLMFDDSQARVFWLTGEMERGSSIQKTADEITKIEKELAVFPKTVIESYLTKIGLNIWDQSEDSNFFTTIVYMTPANIRKEKAKDIIAMLRKKIKQNKTIKKVNFVIDAGGPPTGRPVEIQITGNNDEQRLAALIDLKAHLTNIKGLLEIDDNHQIGKDELKIRLNYDRIARYGIQAYQVAEAIRTAFNGTIVTYMQTPEERIAYRVMLDDQFRKNRTTLDKLKVANNQGKIVPIRDLLLIKERKSIKRIHHYNGDRTIQISSDIDKSKTTPIEVFNKIKNDLPKFSKKYPDTRFIIKGEAEESQKTMQSLFVAFAIAILFIYFLFVLLFNSFTQPILIITAIPFGLIGVVIAFTLHGMNLSMFALLGIIGLTGVVVNDSLVMIDFINQVKKNSPKKNIIEVVIEGAKTRLRPILLTTITTAAGLLPTAYGIGGYDFTISPMVLSISWGLVFATALTLILIPALYVIETDIFKRH